MCQYRPMPHRMALQVSVSGSGSGRYPRRRGPSLDGRGRRYVPGDPGHGVLRAESVRLNIIYDVYPASNLFLDIVSTASMALGQSPSEWQTKSRQTFLWFSSAASSTISITMFPTQDLRFFFSWCRLLFPDRQVVSDNLVLHARFVSN